MYCSDISSFSFILVSSTILLLFPFIYIFDPCHTTIRSIYIPVSLIILIFFPFIHVFNPCNNTNRSIYILVSLIILILFLFIHIFNPCNNTIRSIYILQTKKSKPEILKGVKLNLSDLNLKMKTTNSQ